MSKKITRITIVHKFDDSPDLSWIGEYTDDLDPWNIDRRTGKYIAELSDDELPNRSGREYRFFKPCAGGEEPGSEYYIKNGLQDWVRMEAMEKGHWWMIGIYAEAEIVIKGVRQRIQSGGLWGIESDSDKEFISTVEGEQFGELKNILKELGFSEEEIEEVQIGLSK